MQKICVIQKLLMINNSINMATKKTKTIKVKSYTYDFSKDGLTDSYKTIANAKFDDLKDWERCAISDKVINDYFKKMQEDIDNYLANTDHPVIKEDISPKAEKKPNVFKRFWNWVTRKK